MRRKSEARSSIFGHKYSTDEAYDLIGKGKLVIQSRACMDCHTFFGNGGYYAPDLTRAWMDPVWMRYAGPKRADKLALFLMHPLRLGARAMPDLHIQRDEAEAAVAYLKWMSAIDTNGFPDRFGAVSGNRRPLGGALDVSLAAARRSSTSRPRR